MSYSEMLGVYPKSKRTRSIKEFSNSHGSAPVIWDALAHKWLGTPEFGYWRRTEELWDLWKDKRLPIHQRTVLALTFDRFFLDKKNYKRMADDLEKFLKDYPPKDGYVNHLVAIKNILSSGKITAPCVGFYWTSCGDNQFQDWDDKKDRYRFPDWKKFKEVYSIFKKKDLEA